MTAVLLGLLLVVFAVGFGVCYRELRLTRRGLGAVEEGLRRELWLLGEAQERRLTALAARVAPAGQAPLPHANEEADTDDGETRLMKRPTEEQLAERGTP